MPTLSSVIVEELGGRGLRIELRGAGLPLKGASWRGIQNVKTTWYPGNANEATQQVLGPQEEPSDWEGEWNRTRLAKTPCLFFDGQQEVKVVSPMFLWDAFDEIRIRGPKLRVTWIALDENGATRGTRTREGRLASFEAMPATVHDVPWKARFDWSGRGGAVQKVVATREGDLSSAVRGLMVSTNAIVGVAARSKAILKRVADAQAAAAATAPPIGTSTFLSLGSLETLASAPTALVDAFMVPVNRVASDLGRIVEVTRQARTIPDQIYNSGKAMASGMKDASNRFKDELSRIPAELNSSRSEVSAFGRAQVYFGRVHDAAEDVSSDAAKMEERMSTGGRGMVNLTPRKTIEVHVVKSGDTMASISQRYYGTPDRAVDVARANRLPWHQRNLTPGRTLVIPVLEPTRSA